MQKIVYAKHNNNNLSAQKVRLVAALIRGKKALEAADILRFTNKYAARDMLKVVNSAIANAENNNNMDKKELVIAEVLVDNATTYKRGKAVARGRYHQIFRRNCHITVGVTDKSEVTAKAETVKETVKAVKPETVKAKTAKPKIIKDSKAKK